MSFNLPKAFKTIGNTIADPLKIARPDDSGAEAIAPAAAPVAAPPSPAQTPNKPPRRRSSMPTFLGGGMTSSGASNVGGKTLLGQ